MFIYPLIAALIIAADQITKYIVRAQMQPGDRIPVLGDWFSMYYVRNTGTAFSMFSDNRLITIVLTSVLITVCIIFVIREVKNGSRVLAVLLTFVAAGGLSNLFDRLILGYVTDMISCWTFAVFNVADIFVTCGCFLIVIYAFITMKEDEKKESAKEEKDV